MTTQRMRLDYTITYTTYRDDDHTIKCSLWEDAEKIAQFLATLPLHTNVVLTDGYSKYTFQPNQTVTTSFV